MCLEIPINSRLQLHYLIPPGCTRITYIIQPLNIQSGVMIFMDRLSLYVYMSTHSAYAVRLQLLRAITVIKVYVQNLWMFCYSSGNNILNHAGPWTSSPVSNLELLLLRKIFVCHRTAAQMLSDMEEPLAICDTGGQPSEAVQEGGNMLPICDTVPAAVAPLVTTEGCGNANANANVNVTHFNQWCDCMAMFYVFII